MQSTMKQVREKLIGRRIVHPITSQPFLQQLEKNGYATKSDMELLELKSKATTALDDLITEMVCRCDLLESKYEPAIAEAFAEERKKNEDDREARRALELRVAELEQAVADRDAQLSVQKAQIEKAEAVIKKQVLAGVQNRGGLQSSSGSGEHEGPPLAFDAPLRDIKDFAAREGLTVNTQMSKTRNREQIYGDVMAAYTIKKSSS